MSFTEKQENKLEIIPPYNFIQCRRADIVLKDGLEVGRTYHRHIRFPGDDVSNECAEFQAVAAALWTQEVIDTYIGSLPEPEPETEPEPEPETEPIEPEE